MGVCTVNSSFNNIFPDFMKREMLLLWSFQDIRHSEKIWIGSTQTFQERYKKNKQIEFVFLENQLRLHTLSSNRVKSMTQIFNLAAEANFLVVPSH